MSQTDPSQSPIDAALDLLVYAPVGLALTVGEELPKLAAKGRARLQSPFGTALVVGRFAAAQGRREMDRRFGSSAASRRTSPAASSAPAPHAAGPETGAPPTPAQGRSAASRSASGAPSASVAPEDGPDPASLAIPGYDSLSASQVVQRLAGLSGPELAAVGEYEAAHRSRRTILTRVAQLQAH